MTRAERRAVLRNTLPEYIRDELSKYPCEQALARGVDPAIVHRAARASARATLYAPLSNIYGEGLAALLAQALIYRRANRHVGHLLKVIGTPREVLAVWIQQYELWTSKARLYRDAADIWTLSQLGPGGER